MKIWFYNFESFKKTKELCEKKDFPDLLVVGFSKNAVCFLTRKYFKLLKILLNFSKKHRTKVVLNFYIAKHNLNLLNAFLIENGKICDICGEFFSKKNFSIKLKCNCNILYMFYFDIYNLNILKKIFIKDFDLILGIENDESVVESEYLEKKFKNKLILFGLNNVAECTKVKNITKLCENLREYNVQKN